MILIKEQPEFFRIAMQQVIRAIKNYKPDIIPCKDTGSLQEYLFPAGKLFLCKCYLFSAREIEKQDINFLRKKFKC